MNKKTINEVYNKLRSINSSILDECQNTDYAQVILELLSTWHVVEDAIDLLLNINN